MLWTNWRPDEGKMVYKVRVSPGQFILKKQADQVEVRSKSQES